MSAKTSERDWIGRVKQADAEAEAAWGRLNDQEYLLTENGPTPAALIAIAAELRAQRIARRPGVGQ